jgi:hypothetical protein
MRRTRRRRSFRRDFARLPGRISWLAPANSYWIRRACRWRTSGRVARPARRVRSSRLRMNAAPAFVESRPIAPEPTRPTRENADEKRTIPTACSARESILRAVRTKRAAAPAITATQMGLFFRHQRAARPSWSEPWDHLLGRIAQLLILARPEEEDHRRNVYTDPALLRDRVVALYGDFESGLYHGLEHA